MIVDTNKTILSGLFIVVLPILLVLVISPSGICNNKKDFSENQKIHISKIPYKYQHHLRWCGPASLAMVLSYWGDYISQENIASDIYKPEENGTRISDMDSYAENRGFNSDWGSAKFKNLKKKLRKGYPVIVLQKYSKSNENLHFRVVLGYDDTGFLLHSPKYLQKYSVYFADFSDKKRQKYHMTYDNFAELWENEEELDNLFLSIHISSPSKKDRNPPKISITSPKENQIIENFRFQMSWKGSDMESGIQRYEVKMDNGDWNPTENSSLDFHTSDGKHRIFVRAVDRAGNKARDNTLIKIQTLEENRKRKKIIFIAIIFILLFSYLISKYG